MATTAGGTYYAASSELVSDWPATSLNLANQLESRFAAKANYVRQATAPTGAYNTFWEDTSTTPSGLKIWNGSAWVTFSGAPILTAADVSVTGSPTITTATIDSVNYTLYKWTGLGSVTFARVGLFTAFLCGAGSGGDYGGYARMGGGGRVVEGQFYLPASGTYTVTIGASVPCSNTAYNTLGNPTSIGSFLNTGYAAKDAGAGASSGSDANMIAPYSTSITGSAQSFAASAVATPAANTGQGSYSYFGNPSGSGICIIRVRS